MKIILEGTKTELINALHSLGIPNEVVFDDGSQFLCGDMCGRGHRQKSSVCTIKVLREQFGDTIKKYSSSKEVPNKPEPLKDTLNNFKFDVGFTSDSDNNEIKALAKEQANRRRQVRFHLRSLSQQP